MAVFKKPQGDCLIIENKMNSIEEIAFLRVCQEENFPLITALLSKINPNFIHQYGESPLMHAALHNSEEVLLLLLEHPEINLNLKNSQGYTALDLACIRNHSNIIRILLVKGAEYTEISTHFISHFTEGESYFNWYYEPREFNFHFEKLILIIFTLVFIIRGLLEDDNQSEGFSHSLHSEHLPF